MAERRQSTKKRPPNREPVLRQAWLEVIQQFSSSRLIIGGKSLGGRIASLIADESDVAGLICLGYPFHPTGQPDRLRIEHLQHIKTPTLILQGTRDPFGTQQEVAQYSLSPYYGAALGERRNEVFLASKTHDRTREGSLRLLDDSLRRLRTDYIDLWQLHDLRTMLDLDRIFTRGGAIEALLEARQDGRVRFLGITGHHDPAILLEAMRRFDFDTLLVALNPADVHRLSFI